MNKKAVEINVTTIIVVILGILVLVVLALYFTGGMKDLWGKMIGVRYDVTDIEMARSQCSLFCSANDKISYCEHAFTIRELKDSEVVGTITMYCYSSSIKAEKTPECKASGFGGEGFCTAD